MKKGGIVACFLLITVLVSGCSNNKEIVSDDIISQKHLSVEKTPITVMVKYGFAINTLEAEVERLFPQIDLIQVGNYTYNGSPELEKRFEHDDITEIVMTWPLEAGEKYWADRLLDLSGFPFTGQYNISMLDTISRDGKLYYLPGPSELRAIVYNKTLFEENDWELPTSFEEFIELCNTIEQSNIRALQLNFWNKEILDAAFIGFGYRESFSTPENVKKLDDFNQKGEGGFIIFQAFV